MKWLRAWAIAWLMLNGLVAAKVCAQGDSAGSNPYFEPAAQSGQLGTVEFDPMGSPFPPGRSVMEPEEEGFKWPSLPKPKMPALPKFSLPKLSLPSWSSEKQMTPRQPIRKADEPSTWTKFSSGTKDLFTKTKQTLMPWNHDDESASRSSSVVRRSSARTRTKAKPASSEKKSLFPWFTKEETEEPISTVNDFLSQPRVQ